MTIMHHWKCLYVTTCRKSADVYGLYSSVRANITQSFMLPKLRDEACQSDSGVKYVIY